MNKITVIAHCSIIVQDNFSSTADAHFLDRVHAYDLELIYIYNVQ